MTDPQTPATAAGRLCNAGWHAYPHGDLARCPVCHMTWWKDRTETRSEPYPRPNTATDSQPAATEPDMDVRWQLLEQDVMDWAVRGEFGVRGPELSDIIDKHRPAIEAGMCLHDGIEDASGCAHA